LLKKPLFALVRQLDYERLNRHVAEALESDRRVTTELRCERVDGRPLVVQLVSIRLRALDVSPLCHTALFDVTAQRTAETHLRVLASLGQALVGSLGHASLLASFAKIVTPTIADACIVRIEGEHAIAHVDLEVAARLDVDWRAGRLPVEVIALSGERRARPWLLDDPATIAWLGFPALAQPILVRDAVVGHALFGARGRSAAGPGGALVLEQATRQLSRALESADLYKEALRDVRIREEFLAVVSHDIVNAASAIRLSVDPLAGRADEERRVSADAAARVRRAADWILELVEKLLDISRIRGGAFPLERRGEHAASLVHEVVAILEPRAGARRVTVADECDDAAIVTADGERTKQVLLNLVGNAVKFAREGGHVVVGLEVSGAEVLFRVSDDGPGVPIADRANVFERFWQVRDLRRRGGFGLGLAIAKALVEAQGGRIWVEEARGGGALFCFTLPRATEGGADLVAHERPPDERQH